MYTSTFSDLLTCMYQNHSQSKIVSTHPVQGVQGQWNTFYVTGWCCFRIDDQIKKYTPFLEKSRRPLPKIIAKEVYPLNVSKKVYHRDSKAHPITYIMRISKKIFQEWRLNFIHPCEPD